MQPRGDTALFSSVHRQFGHVSQKLPQHHRILSGNGTRRGYGDGMLMKSGIRRSRKGNPPLA
jgi:hypothetical protein